MSRRALLLLAFLQLLRMRKRRQGGKSDGNVLEALIVPQGLHSLFQWICACGLRIYLATASIVSIQSFSCVIDLWSSLFTLGKAQTSLALLSLYCRLHGRFVVNVVYFIELILNISYVSTYHQVLY